ncbi:MAG: hypothetical protein ACE5LU_29130, partial [Anaerolineae bacterium]
LPGADKGITRSGGIKVWFFARALGVSVPDLLARAKAIGIPAKAPMSVIPHEDIERLGGAMVDSGAARKASSEAMDPRLPEHYRDPSTDGALEANTPAARLALQGENPMHVNKDHPRLRGKALRWLSEEVCDRRGLRNWQPISVDEKTAREIAPNAGGFTSQGGQIRFGRMILAEKSEEAHEAHKARLRARAEAVNPDLVAKHSAEGDQNPFRGPTQSEVEYFDQFGQSLGGVRAGPSIDRSRAVPKSRMGIPRREERKRVWTGWKPAD